MTVNNKYATTRKKKHPSTTVKNVVKGPFFVFNDSLTTALPTVVLYRPLWIFMPRFFDIHGGRVSSTTKICIIVDGIRPAIKMLTSSELTCGSHRLLAVHAVIFSPTVINLWQMAGPLKAC
jgi:hypothetical protein